MQKYKNNKFCKGLSSYRSVRNDTTSCIGNILSNSKNVLESCNWEKISVMDDWFINIEGIYYYSINRTMVLELLCLENKENDRIILSGLGSVRIKQGCYAKFDSVLLVGSNAVKINSSFEIAKISHNEQIFNFSYSKYINFNKINITNFNDISILEPNNTQWLILPVFVN